MSISVIRVNYDIEVREIQGTLIEDSTKLMIRDQVWLEIKTNSETPIDLNDESENKNKIEQHIYSRRET